MDWFFFTVALVLWWLSCTDTGGNLMGAILTRIRCSAYHSLIEAEDRTRRPDA